MTYLTESIIEDTALAWYSELGYATLYGGEIAPGEPAAERTYYNEVILVGRLLDALARLNPSIPAQALEEAVRKVTHPETTSLLVNNHSFHRMLVNGVDVEYRSSDGRIVGDRARLIDFHVLENNDWLAVNQFTVIDNTFAN